MKYIVASLNSTMNRLRLLLVGLPIFLFSRDILNILSPKPTDHDDHRNQQHHNRPSQFQPKSQQQIIPEPLPFPTQQGFFFLFFLLTCLEFLCMDRILLRLLFFFFQKPIVNIGGNIGLGSTVNIAFCTSCSYKFNTLSLRCIPFLFSFFSFLIWFFFWNNVLLCYLFQWVWTLELIFWKTCLLSMVFCKE